MITCLISLTIATILALTGIPSASASDKIKDAPFDLEWGMDGQALLVDNGQMGAFDTDSLALVFKIKKPGIFYQFPDRTRLITLYSYDKVGVQRIEWRSRRSSWRDFLQLDMALSEKYGTGTPIGDSAFKPCVFKELEGFCTKKPRTDEKTGKTLPIPVTIFAKFYNDGLIFHRWDDLKQTHRVFYFGPEFMNRP